MAKEISSELLNTILTRVGGPGNIASCGNCMTRLRLGVHDSSLVDPDIKTLEGVKGVILTSDQVQVVFGPGKAHRAAKAMSELLGEAPVQDAAEIAAQNKRQLKAKQTSGVQQFLAKFATIFTPLIPGFIAAGLLLGIATLIATVMHVPADAQGTLPDALNFMKVFSKGLFTFLVILVGYNAAQAFGGTGVNGAIIAALFLLGYNPAATTGYYAGFSRFLWSAHRSARQYYRRVDCRMGLRSH
ncbi:N-acetylmuramic acid-specific PTS system EIIBC component [Escherichia coli]|nr:N-acetylmuramic acid-specific PTS system EIIBC component [Escherichia coli]